MVGQAWVYAARRGANFLLFQHNLLASTLATARVAACSEGPRLVNRKSTRRAGSTTSRLPEEMYVVDGVWLKWRLSDNKCHIACQVRVVLRAGCLGDQTNVERRALTCFGNREARYAERSRSLGCNADRRAGLGAHVCQRHFHFLIERIRRLDTVNQPYSGLTIDRVHANIIASVDLCLRIAHVNVQRVVCVFRRHADRGQALRHHSRTVVQAVDQVFDRRDVRVRILHTKCNHLARCDGRIACGDHAILRRHARETWLASRLAVRVGAADVDAHVVLMILGRDVDVRVLV